MNDELKKSAAGTGVAGSDSLSSAMPFLRRRALLISLAVAAAAWITLMLAMYLRVRERGAVLGAAVGWPIAYVGCLVMCWFLVRFSEMTDESDLKEPSGDLQLKLRRAGRVAFVRWVNVVAIIFPSAVLVLALLGLFGLISPVE